MANPRDFERDMEAAGVDIARETANLRGFGENASRASESIDRVGKDMTEMGREVLKFQKALFKAGASLAKSETPFEDLMKQDKELSRQKELLIASIQEQTRLLNQGGTVDKDLLEADKKLLAQKNEEIAKNRLEKLYAKDKPPSEKEGWGSTLITKMGTWAETAILGMFAKIGTEMGRYALNKMDEFKEMVWEMNAKTREGAKITGNIFETTSDVAYSKAQDQKMKGLVEELKLSKGLSYFGMDKEATASIDTYARAYNKNNEFAGKSVEELTLEFDKLGTVALATGLGFKKTMDEITLASRKYDLGRTESTNLLVWANDQEKKKGLSELELVNNYKSLQSSLAMFGYNIYQSAGMADKFAKALQEGRIGLGDIVNYSKGIQGAGAGEIYTLFQQGAKKGGKVAPLMNQALSSFGNDIFGFEEWAKAFMQGKTKAKDLFPTAKNITSNDMIEAFTDVMRDILPAGKAGGIFSKVAMSRKLADIFKMNALPMDFDVAEQMYNDKFKITKADVIKGKKLPEGASPVEDMTLTDIAGKLDDEIGRLDKIDNSINRWVTHAAIKIGNIFGGAPGAEDYIARGTSILNNFNPNKASGGPAAILQSIQDDMNKSNLSKVERDNYQKSMIDLIKNNPVLLSEITSGKERGTQIFKATINVLDQTALLAKLKAYDDSLKTKTTESMFTNIEDN